ncbi:hypothetical protein PF006_g14080 [Phytophthora fragariae]|uniref:Uncharacterized protein n=1 Tax=Phytophthora fragariae TaxID=53985 RepID=A0A6A3TJL3_9STRA|nr:hypothetical protein PF003_g35766 [Phytophthora fragariae]KAE9000596.1 hypothetical protein PF011_g14110 [Phytophthora fragariae]KAE9137875.1 hypothetical protein PF006_g14080 [Phytophthora fragariae]KAE9217095.1 hypothetical protein PF004_g14252 [Phytophthora fragariae]
MFVEIVMAKAARVARGGGGVGGTVGGDRGGLAHQRVSGVVAVAVGGDRGDVGRRRSGGVEVLDFVLLWTRYSKSEYHVESVHDKPKTPKRRERKSAGILQRALGVNQVGDQVARTIVFADDGALAPSEEIVGHQQEDCSLEAPIGGLLLAGQKTATMHLAASGVAIAWLVPEYLGMGTSGAFPAGRAAEELLCSLHCSPLLHLEL